MKITARHGRIFFGRREEAHMATVEFKPQDLWIGAFWKRTTDSVVDNGTDIWVCIIPMFPVHVFIGER